MTKEGAIETAVGALVESDAAQEVVAEFVEMGIDVFLEEGVVREIPVVGTIVGLLRAGASVRARLFAKKLMEFMRDLSAVPADRRHEMVTRLQADPAYERKVGEHVTELLERIDSHRKPLMLARVFAGYADGKIDAAMLHRLSSAIERVPGFEIDRLRPFCEAPQETRDAPVVTLQNLSAAGLLNSVSGWGLLCISQMRSPRHFFA